MRFTLKKALVTSLVLFGVVFLTLKPVSAIVDPLQVTNNRFGIHIVDENDLKLAAELVNSSGGEWGYVTLVIREDDRILDKWQAAFDKMRELKLIPIVRLATKMEDNGWAKPREEDIVNWAEFLNQLNWVVKNRYIIIFNEPNHAREWGGEVSPDEYARITRITYERLKEKSQDFFVLPAGFDAAAPNSKTSLDIYGFFRKMYESDPEIFSFFDGWTSHAYPNPNFSGLPSHSGRMSIRSFEWEINFLEPLGLKPDIPIFITETGWKHKEGIKEDENAFSAEKVAEYFKSAFNSAWSNTQVVAVTPFVLRYLEEPFDHFSWIKVDSKDFYPQYNEIQRLTKFKGEPVQEYSSSLSSEKIPEKLVVNSEYKFILSFKNTGQSIWSNENVRLVFTTTLPDESVRVGEISQTKPFEQANIEVTVKTPEEVSQHSIELVLEHKGEPFSETVINNISLIPPPSLLVRAKLWIKSNHSADDLTLMMFDQKKLAKIFEPFSITDGTGRIDEIYGVVPQRDYRFVLSKPNYLPRQEVVKINETKTTVSFERLLPFDINGDGFLSGKDILSALRHPIKTVSLISPFGEK